jgi:hypothetical protein
MQTSGSLSDNARTRISRDAARCRRPRGGPHTVTRSPKLGRAIGRRSTRQESRRRREATSVPRRAANCHDCEPLSQLHSPNDRARPQLCADTSVMCRVAEGGWRRLDADLPLGPPLTPSVTALREKSGRPQITSLNQANGRTNVDHQLGWKTPRDEAAAQAGWR